MGIVVLFILHYQFTPEFTERKIYKPTSSYTREPAKNHVEYFHYVAPKAEAAAVAAPSVVEPETPSAAAMQEMGDLGVEAYTGGSPYDCKPSRVPRGTRALDYVAPPGSAWPVNCDQDDNQALCDVVKKVAVDREVLTAVCNSNVIGQLEKWVDANRRSGITNMVIIAIDNRLPEWLEKNGVACWHKVQSAVGSHKISAQKFKLVKQFLSTGTSVIMSDIDVVYLQNPFLFLHKVRASARQPPATHPQSPPTPHPTRWRASASGRGHRGHHRRLGRRLGLRVDGAAGRRVHRRLRPLPPRDAHHGVELRAVVRARDAGLAAADDHPGVPHGARGHMGPGAALSPDLARSRPISPRARGGARPPLGRRWRAPRATTTLPLASPSARSTTGASPTRRPSSGGCASSLRCRITCRWWCTPTTTSQRSRACAPSSTGGT